MLLFCHSTGKLVVKRLKYWRPTQFYGTIQQPWIKAFNYCQANKKSLLSVGTVKEQQELVANVLTLVSKGTTRQRDQTNYKYLNTFPKSQIQLAP